MVFSVGQLWEYAEVPVAERMNYRFCPAGSRGTKLSRSEHVTMYLDMFLPVCWYFSRVLTLFATDIQKTLPLAGLLGQTSEEIANPGPVLERLSVHRLSATSPTWIAAVAWSPGPPQRALPVACVGRCPRRQASFSARSGRLLPGQQLPARWGTSATTPNWPECGL